MINRRQLLAALATAAGGMALQDPARRAQASSGPEWKGYASAVVIDACAVPGRSDDDNHVFDADELNDIRNSGIAAINLTVSSVGSYADDFDQTVQNIAYWDKQIAAHPDVFVRITRGAQIEEAKRSGRLGLMFGFQDATPYGENLDRFDAFHELGVRIVQLTYNRRNLIGDGCLEPGNAGLSTLGVQLLARLNERGVLVDLSHCGQRTTHEAIVSSTRPVAITHSGCNAVARWPRNKDDAELRLLADRGGVIGIYFMPYLRSDGQVMAADVVRHVEHALDVCGEDHVGIGSDGMTSAIRLTAAYKKQYADDIAEREKLGVAAPGERADSYTFAPDLNTPRRFDRLASLLAQRGHSDVVVAKVIGGNFARLFREVIV